MTGSRLLKGYSVSFLRFLNHQQKDNPQTHCTPIANTKKEKGVTLWCVGNAFYSLRAHFYRPSWLHINSKTTQSETAKPIALDGSCFLHFSLFFKLISFLPFPTLRVPTTLVLRHSSTALLCHPHSTTTALLAFASSPFNSPLFLADCPRGLPSNTPVPVHTTACSFVSSSSYFYHYFGNVRPLCSAAPHRAGTRRPRCQR